MVRPQVTASRSCSRPLANDAMPGRPALRAVSIHWERFSPVRLVIMAANARTWPDAAWSSGQRSRMALRRGFSSSVRVSGRWQSQFVTSRTVGGAGGSGSRGGAVAGEVVADDGVAAVVVECLDLAEQALDAAVGAVGVLVEVGLERVELAGARSLPAAVGEFLPGRGAVESLDGVQAPAQVAGDLPQSAPFGAQLVDQGVVPPGALGVLPGGVQLPVPCGSGRAGSCSCGTGAGDGSGRQARCAAAHFSTALARFCHRWNRSATWTACGAPVRAPSNGTVRFQNCRNACCRHARIGRSGRVMRGLGQAASRSQVLRCRGCSGVERAILATTTP